jgi:hypothetical protein
MRVITSTSSAGANAAVLLEASGPKGAIIFKPVIDILECARLNPAGTPLRFSAPCDEACVLQHLEVLGDGGKTHSERLGELCHRCLAQREPRKDRPACGVSERCEFDAKRIGYHVEYNLLFN